VQHGGSSYTITAVNGNTVTMEKVVAQANDPVNWVAVGGNTRNDTGKIAYSSDGRTWTAVPDSTFGTTNTDYIMAIAWGNGRFVAVGGFGKMAYSADGGANAVGESWTAVADSTFENSIINAIAYGNNRFVAVGENGRMAYCDW
jgi:photosystem II stability/assembly factor-like uncharacterized protein